MRAVLTLLKSTDITAQDALVGKVRPSFQENWDSLFKLNNESEKICRNSQAALTVVSHFIERKKNQRCVAVPQADSPANASSTRNCIAKDSNIDQAHPSACLWFACESMVNQIWQGNTGVSVKL